MAASPPHPRWDSGIPPILRPLVRAYLFGYASAAGPRLLTLVLQHAARRRRDSKQTTTARETPPAEPFLPALQRILLGPLGVQSFPAFCAALVGGTTFLEVHVLPGEAGQGTRH
jgi:hypothetical protein